MHRVLEPRRWPGRDELRAIEIGFTWLGASAQGSGINAEARLLLMSHAFDRLRVARVDLKTDARNRRRRQALEAPGRRGSARAAAGQPRAEADSRT
ncbi:MAG: GNAT family N-acetyltransferase [Streptosporangiaceae bacterium]